MRFSIVLLALILAHSIYSAQADELPQFVVPGHESEMKLLNDLHRLHHGNAFTNCTLWDGWLPQATLWTAEEPRNKYRQALLSRRIDDEGYVAVQQHRGMAHSDGWPFPGWPQSTGKGFHFSLTGDVWAIQNFQLKPLSDTKGWEISGAEVIGIDPQRGLQLRATSDVISISTPPFRCGTIVAPFARMEWATSGLNKQSQLKWMWLLDGEGEWNDQRFVNFARPTRENELQYVNVPLYRQSSYAGLLTRYRVVIDHAAGSTIDLKSIITAIDTRHPTTNWNYLQSTCAYFNWTGDVEFLRDNITRMREAARFGLNEFSLVTQKHVMVPWVGHEGRTGLVVKPDGTKQLRPGVGVGNNYWDLLPFGGHDAIATMLAYDGLSQLAQLEHAIKSHSQWQIAEPDKQLSAAAISALCAEIRTDFQQRFWNADRQRFVGWIDMDGLPQDYGFSFVNLEAIHYGLASSEQAEKILQWLSGERTIEGDTSTGADIYHWRFAPRATTRRNVETYAWVWSAPETIQWGNQVQDGGAVLGFSYHDLIARIKTRGPDDAWRRLQTILKWFDEVQGEGGYRAYYAKPGRGTLQGGGPPGGLGLDQEFLESVLVPQVMLYGFLGLQITPDGCTINPRLPSDWPSLTITQVHLRDYIVNITAHQDGRVTVEPVIHGKEPLSVNIGDKNIELK